MAGVIASFFSSFTLCPTELVKCKLQSMREVAVWMFFIHTCEMFAILILNLYAFQNDTKQTQTKHITPLQLTRQIFKQEGILGFYRGLGKKLINVY